MAPDYPQVLTGPVRFVPYVPPTAGSAVAVEATATFVPPPMALDRFPAEPRARRRVDLLAVVRRPSRVAQLEQLLARYRWANAGLRERLAELTVRHEATLDAIAVIVDEEARVIGHAHPVIVRVRAQLDAASQERPA